MLRIFRTSSPGDSISSNLKGTALRSRGGEAGYIEVLQQRAGCFSLVGSVAMLADLKNFY